MNNARECPHCGRTNLFRSAASSGGGHAPNYLPGLGSFFRSARFEVIVCQDCGLTRFFAERDAMRKITDSKKWQRVP